MGELASLRAILISVGLRLVAGLGPVLAAIMGILPRSACIPTILIARHTIRFRVSVGAPVLLHVVLAHEGLVANGTMHALFAGMFLAMPCSVARREGGGAGM